MSTHRLPGRARRVRIPRLPVIPAPALTIRPLSSRLEGVLLTSPLVADCAVIGIYSEEQATELPRAYIVPDAQHAKSPTLETDVAKWVEDKLAPHKKLRGGVVVVDVIPKRCVPASARSSSRSELTVPSRP